MHNRLDPPDVTEAGLRRVLYRFDCPTSLALGEYHLDILEPLVRQTVAAHLMDCDNCRADLQIVREFLKPDQAAAPGGIRRLVANLLNPPASGLALAGIRGSAAASASRVYQIENVTVTLGPGPEPGGLIGLVNVDGVDPSRLAGSSVRTQLASGLETRTTLDDLGNFELEDLIAGDYALELDLPESIVVVAQIRVS